MTKKGWLPQKLIRPKNLHQIKFTKQKNTRWNATNQTYQNIPTKQAYQTKPTKPYLPDQTYQTNPKFSKEQKQSVKIKFMSKFGKSKH